MEASIQPQFTVRTIETLRHMVKAIDPNDIRSYGQVLCIRNGRACVTNGFGLMTCSRSDFDGRDEVLTDFLQPTMVKFPGFEACLPKPEEEGIAVDAQAVHFLACQWKPAKQVAYLRFDSGATHQELAIVPKAKGQGQFFNPAMIQKYAKVLPKTVRPVSAKVVDEKLVIYYTDGFMILVCAVHAGEEGK